MSDGDVFLGELRLVQYL